MNRNYPFFEGPCYESKQPEEKEEKEQELTLEEMQEKLRDPYFLPSFKELARHLGAFPGYSRFRVQDDKRVSPNNIYYVINNPFSHFNS